MVSKDIYKEYAKHNTILPINIDNNQKYRLFEMCRNIIENDNPHTSIFLRENTIRIPKQGYGYNDIHWFELCVTHLAFHIMSDPMAYIKYCLDYAMIINKIEMQHPIDYLYVEYNQIRELFKNEINRK